MPAKMKAAESDNTVALNVLQKYRKSKYQKLVLSPIDLLVFSVISDNLDDYKDALKAIERMTNTFVNWNDLRVARMAEIARQIDPLDDADERAIRVRKMLMNLFDLCGSMDLSFLQQMKVSEGRRHLAKLDNDISRVVLNHVLFTLCPGTTIPVSPEGLKVAREHKLISRSGSKAQLQKVLQSELELEEAGELVQFLETEAYDQPIGFEPNRAPKKKTRRKSRKSS